MVIRGLSDFRLDVNTRYEGGWDAYNVLQGAYSIRMSRLETQTTVLGAEQPNDSPAVEYHYDLIQAPFPFDSLMGNHGPSADLSAGDFGRNRDDGASREISDCAKKLLQGFFPKVDLSKVRLRLGLPAIVPENTTSGDKIGGLTFGYTIYTDSQQDFESHYGASWSALEFLAHELTHVDQYRRLSKAGFLLGYTLEGLYQGLIRPAPEAISATYKKNAFETRAQTNAASIIRKLKRSGASPCPIEVGILAVVDVR